MRGLALGLALLALLVGAAVVVLSAQSFSSSTCAQEGGGEPGPPPSAAPEANDTVLRQIAQVIWDKQQQGQAAGEQDLLALTEQLTGGTSITLGAQAVGGIAELPQPAVLAGDSPDC